MRLYSGARSALRAYDNVWVTDSSWCSIWAYTLFQHSRITFGASSTFWPISPWGSLRAFFGFFGHSCSTLRSWITLRSRFHRRTNNNMRLRFYTNGALISFHNVWITLSTRLSFWAKRDH